MTRCRFCGRDKDEAYRSVSYYCAPPFEVRMHSWDNTNPAEVLRDIAVEVASAAGFEVDHESFDRAAAYMDESRHPTFYRIVDGYNSTDKPVLQKLRAVKTTPKGCWVVHSWAWPLSEPLTTREALRNAGARFVSQGTRRAYVYPTIELALDSYIIRKRRQIQHARNSLEWAENCLTWASSADIQDEMLVFDEPVGTASPFSLENLNVR